jgi:DNA-binding transcriptional LysR family regulator
VLAVRQLEALVAIADCEHFGRAAGRLGITTAAISSLLSRLERTVGTTLVRRTTRRVCLTADGVGLLATARAAVAAMARVGERAATIAAGRAGVVRIGVVAGCERTAAGVARALRRSAPGWSVRTAVMDRRSLVLALRHGRVELAVGPRFGVAPAAASWTPVGDRFGGEILIWRRGWTCPVPEGLSGPRGLVARAGLRWPRSAADWATRPEELGARRQARARAPTQPMRSS